MARLSLGARDYSQRDSRERGRGSTKQRRTQSGRRTESERLTQKAVADKVSERLENYSEGEIAVAADSPKDTAQSWKLGRRAPNTAYMLTLARSIDEIGMLLAEEGDLGRFYGNEARIRKMLQEHALHETPEGRFARQILREAGAQ